MPNGLIMATSVENLHYDNSNFNWRRIDLLLQRRVWRRIIGLLRPDKRLPLRDDLNGKVDRRPRALGSYLISVRSVVRVYPGPLDEAEAPQEAGRFWGWRDRPTSPGR